MRSKRLFCLLVILFFASTALLNGKVKSKITKADSVSVYREILQKKEIRIGISKHYPPLNFNAGKRGLEIEMAKKLGEFLGVKIRLIPLPVSDYIPSLKNKRVDIVIAGLSRNLVRAGNIWFSVPYLSVTPGVLANKQILPQTKFGEEFEQSPIKTIWDLGRINRFRFAVKKGSSYEHLLKRRFPNSPKIFIKTNEEGLELLQNGKVHGFVHDSLYLQYLYKKSGKLRSAFELLQGGKQIEKICIGLPFGDIVLKNQIDIFVQELVRQGQFDEWLKQYNK